MRAIYIWMGSLIALLVIGIAVAYEPKSPQAVSNSAWSSHQVMLHIGNDTVKTWTTKGRVQQGTYGLGYEFVDKETDKLIRISGTVIVVPL